MSTILLDFASDESGGTAIEYTLIASLIALASAVAANALGLAVQDMIQGVADELNLHSLG